jgi:hypothetical protein
MYICIYVYTYTYIHIYILIGSILATSWIGSSSSLSYKIKKDLKN